MCYFMLKKNDWLWEIKRINFIKSYYLKRWSKLSSYGIIKAKYEINWEWVDFGWNVIFKWEKIGQGIVIKQRRDERTK